VKKQKGINPEIEAALNKLLQQVMADPEASLTDKMKIMDRLLKLEALKQKADLDEWGSGFFSGDEDDEK
jgi:tripartite-type tricarboxylate transporter receptor subunit TctC